MRRQVVENRAFINFFVAEETTPEEQANGSSGLRVKKIPADEAVIAQLPQYKPMQTLKLLAVLKDAAGGKAQPHIIGVVPAGAAPKATA
ncbi:hypothetical protein D3C84_1210560 [compost metagenome]